SNVTVMSNMFQSATAFNQDIGNWNTSNVTNMSDMFNTAAQFNQDVSGWCVPNIGSEPSSFKTNANATWRNDASKQPQWGNCPSNATLVITSDDSDNIITTGQVTLTATFSQNMAASPKISISGVVTNVSMTQSTTAAVWTYYWQVPSNISSGTTLNVTATATDTNSRSYSGNASLTLTISPTFYLASNGVTIKCSGCSAGDTGMVSGTIYTAAANSNISSLIAAGNYNLATTLVTNMNERFANNNSFNTDIGFWDTSNVTTMIGMFSSASSFNQNIGAWDTSSVTTMRSMFASAFAFNNGGSNTINNWDTSSVTDMSYIFHIASAFNQIIGSWDTSNVTTMKYMFAAADAFNQNIGGWDTSEVTDMYAMFYHTDAFNQNIGSWDTSKVTDMEYMFSITDAFNQNIGGWNTSNVTNMSYMFNKASVFNQNIGAWNTSSVTDMEGMFEGTGPGNYTVFNNGGSSSINNWDTSSVIFMRKMFYASNFNQNIGNWNTSSVITMNGMFNYAQNFNQDLSGWCVSRFSSEPTDFKTSANATWRNDASKQPQWGVCNSNVSVILSDTDTDNLLAASDTVTITAFFTEAMTATPRISISGLVTNVVMTKISIGGNSSVVTQLGADIDGQRTNDDNGRSVSLSSDGLTVAIGSPEWENTGTIPNRFSEGKVAIYRWNGSAWTQLGSNIRGEARDNYSGYSLSLSSNGTRVAIGAYGNDGNGANSGHVRIYDYNGSAWVQVGADIDGEADSDGSGKSLSLSSDGSRVAIGAMDNDGNGSNSGHVRIYDYNGSAWVQVGADIDGEAAGDKSGGAVSLSSDGTRVAIGSEDNNGANGSDSGHVRVYDYNGSAWAQVGADIDGEAANDLSGWSVSLSADGTRVAIGAKGNDGNGSDSGHVRVYDYNGSAWVQVGGDIDGEAAGDQSGSSVSLSSDGSRLVIGATGNDAGNASSDNRGHVRIYDYNGSAWVQVGADIDGEGAGDASGFSVSISSDGTRIAVGAPSNNGAASDAGHVRVYSLPGEVYKYTWDIDSGSTPPSGIYYATVSGTTVATGGAYSGTQSLTFTLDTTAPTVTLTDTDSDNVVNVSQVVTITAIFSETMAATPTISITGIVTNVIMTPIAGTTSYTYRWDTSSGTLTTGNYAATVSGTDLIGNPYVAGTQSITFRVDTTSPTLTITTPSGPKVSNSSLVVTLTYDEAVTGLTTNTAQFSEAINIASLQLLSASSDGRTYTVRITPQAEGLVKLTHAPGSPPVQDLAGNSIASTVSCSFTYDTSSPEVLLVSDITSPTLGISNVVSISAYFSETVSPTPTLSISGLITNTAMSKFSRTPVNQIGQSLDGDGAGDWLGFYSQTSDSGNRIIVGGMRGNSGAGYARIFEWNGKQWVQLGNDINGSAGDGYGRTVAISGDGNVVAVGGSGGASNSNRGKYGVYTLVGNTWTIRNGFIYGEAANDLQAIGSSIALNHDGSIVAFGAGKNKGGSASSNRGHIRVFRWDGNNLNQMGSDIDGEGTNGRLGEGSSAVDLSKDGLRLVAGAPTYISNNGVVKIYDWNGSNAWVKSADIFDPVDSSGSTIGRSVSITEDGKTILVGATLGNSTGHVLLFENEIISGVSTWTHKATIAGDAANDGFGYSSAISGNGSKILIGAIDATGGANARGYYKLFSWDGNIATQIGSKVSGESATDFLGTHVHLGRNGIGIIGAPYQNGQAGRVKVIGVDRYEYSWDIDTPSIPSDGNYYATVAGSDLAGNPYAGTESITFTLDTTAPTVTLTDTDSDNLVSTSEVVTITAGFSEVMTATPTISITGIVTNVIMTPIAGTTSYTYRWDTSSGTLTTGNYAATVSGTDLIGNAYVAGTQSITFTVDSSAPTVTITTNDPDNTIKPGDNITVTVTFNEPMASGPRITIGSAVNNVALTATNSTTFTYSWSTGSVSAGSYTVTVTGTDLAGNTYAGSDSIKITLDNTAPTVTLSDTDDDNLLAASDTVTITALFNEAMTST
ncbi:hypothetical protein DEJ39_08430, partial [Bacteroidetes bacterium SCGC AAA795-G10]